MLVPVMASRNYNYKMTIRFSRNLELLLNAIWTQCASYWKWILIDSYLKAYGLVWLWHGSLNVFLSKLNSKDPSLKPAEHHKMLILSRRTSHGIDSVSDFAWQRFTVFFKQSKTINDIASNVYALIDSISCMTCHK